MTKNKDIISKDDILQIEKYIYELQRYTEQVDIMKDVSMPKYDNIVREINYMSMGLSIYKKLFPKDIPVMGLCLDDIKKEDKYLKYWVFSSAESAAHILKDDAKKITMMCKGVRSKPVAQYGLEKPIENSDGSLRYLTRGWKFMYKEDFDKNPDNSELFYSPASSIFKLKTVKYSEKR